VNSSFWFTLKIAGVAVAGNALGAGFYWLRTGSRAEVMATDGRESV
jgi:hypothetical protein